MDYCTVVLGAIVAVGLVLFLYLPEYRLGGTRNTPAGLFDIESVAGLTGHRTTLLLLLVLLLWTVSTFAGKVFLTPTEK